MYESEKSAFLNNLNKTVDAIVAGDQRLSQTNELLKEVLDVVKNTMNNDSAMFLKSLQSLLECFENNRKNFNTKNSTYECDQRGNGRISLKKQLNSSDSMQYIL